MGANTDSRTYFDELCAGLCWRQKDPVVMLWGYFDESGYDDPSTGKLCRLSIGGCVASCENWRGFEEKWNTALKKFKFDMFHMADFEAWKGKFDFKMPDGSRDYEKHRFVLNTFLSIIGDSRPFCFGFTEDISANKFDKKYEECATDAILHFSEFAIDRYEDKISLIFSRHNDYPWSRLEKLFSGITKNNFNLGTIGTDVPSNLCHLQAADIIAYEVSRIERDTNIPERYPLCRLGELHCKWRFSRGVPALAGEAF